MLIGGNRRPSVPCQRYRKEDNGKLVATLQDKAQMNLEVRAARRPMPRQMDAGDWNGDVGGSGHLGPYTMRSRATTAEVDAHWRQAEQLRTGPTSVLRPVNRYDSQLDVAGLRGNNPPQSSVRRTGGASLEIRRSSEGPEESVHASRRLMPRVAAGTRRDEDPSSRSLPVTDGYSHTRAQSSHSSEDLSESPARCATHSTSREVRRQSYQPRRTEVFLTPPREQVRDPSPPNTVSSSASTALTSSPFAPSVVDTPSSVASLRRTPPTIPPPDNSGSQREENRAPHDFLLSSSVAPQVTISDRASSEDPSVRSRSDGASHGITPQSPQSSPVLEEPVPYLSLPTATTRTALTPQQQREQLYAFRRDMRQVFARVDEMVDLHRDMFKSDALSGMPAFDAGVAKDTQAFASETFEQLTSLRTKFEEMTQAWAAASQTPAQTESDQSTSSRRCSATITSDESTDDEPSEWRRTEPFIGHRQPTDSSESSSSRYTSQTPPSMGHTDNDQRLRWEPSLSNLSDDDSSSSSEPSSSLFSEMPTLSRPSTSSSSTTTRANVFEDFDKRMEEIRASLNSIARDQPRLSSELSRRAPVPKSSGSKRRDEEDDRRENNPSAGNRTYWQEQNQEQNQSGRRDREARLRQLLRELQSTGDSDASQSD